MPRTADPATRERIVTTAARLFYERGIRDVGMAEIVTEAGCGKNALYRWFPSKTDLVAAYLQDFGARRDVSSAQALEGLEDAPAEALVALTREIAERTTARGFRGCAFRNYVREFTSYEDEPGRLALAWLRKARAHVRRLVRQLDVEGPDVLAEHIWLIIEGLYSPVPSSRRKHDAAIAVRLVEELVGV